MRNCIQIALISIGLLFAQALSAQSIVMQIQPEYSAVCAGEGTQLTVAATGNNLQYQWQYRRGNDFIDLLDNQQYSGSQSPNLTISAIDFNRNRWNYRCQISNNTETVFSKEVKTTLKNAAFAHQPKAVTGYVGDAVNFHLVASGEQLTFQWQMDIGEGFVNLTEGKKFAGTKGDILSVSNLEMDMNDTRFRCIVTGAACEPIILTSNDALLTVQTGINTLKNSMPITGTPILYFAGPTLTGSGVTNAIFIDGATITVDGGVEVANGSTILGTYNSKFNLTGDLAKTGGAGAILFEPNDSTIFAFSGGNPQEISGSGLFNFHRLEVNKSSATDELTLMTNIDIRKSLVFGTGDINLNGQQIALTFVEYPNMPTGVCPDISAGCPLSLSNGNLFDFPTIINETDDNRIKGSTGQIVMENQEIASNGNPFLNGLNLGNMGIELTNMTGNSLLGDVLTFTRKHHTFSINGGSSVDRTYDIQRNNTGANTDLDYKFHYLDGDVPGTISDEENLVFFRSIDDGASWNIEFADENDATANYVGKNDIADITQLRTLADCGNIPIPSYSFSSPQVCYGESVTVTPDIANGPATSFTWEITNATGTYLTPNTTGSYTITGSEDSTQMQTLRLTAFNNLGCYASVEIGVQHIEVPILDLGDDQFLCEDDMIQLVAQSTDVMDWIDWELDGVIVSNGEIYNYTSDGVGIADIQLTVTNLYGCASSDTLIITEALNPVVDLADELIVCETGTQITLNAGTDGDQYNWSPGGASTQTISPVITNDFSDYFVTVTNTTTTCSTIDNIFVTLSDVMISETHTDINCFGNSTGDINLTTFGTNPQSSNFSYAWIGPNGFTSIADDIDNLFSGSYNVTVTDDFGCTETFPTDIVLSQPSSALEVAEVVSDATCFGENDGQIILNPSGGTPNGSSPLYGYSWAGPNGFVASTANINGLMAGDYTIQVSDANDCIFNKTITVGEAPAMTSTLTFTSVSCFGLADGVIDLIPAGGTPGSPNYTFNWTGPNGFVATTEDLTGLIAGLYSVTITDGNFCTQTLSHNLFQPSEIIVNEVLTPVSCFGGDDGVISLANNNSNGCDFDLTFAWSSALGGPIASTSEVLTDLVAGDYMVTVTTNFSCSGSVDPGCSIVETYQISEPTTISATANTTNASGCVNNGTIDLMPMGGTGTLTYLWSNNATTQDINGLAAGDYTVQITDANGCIFNSQTFTVSTITGIMVTETISPITCNNANDGAIDITVNGGNPPYNYSWQLANGSTSTSSNLSGLIPGNYNLTVTDNLGCEAIKMYTFTEPLILNATAIVTNVSCNGGNDGQIIANPSGGTPPFNYLWSVNASNQTTQMVSNLVADDYTVTITDDNLCQIIKTFTVTQPSLLVANPIVSIDLACFDDTDGQVNANGSGGTSPYTYLWSNSVTTKFNSNLAPQMYSVTITDAKGCTATGSVNLTAPTEIAIIENISNVTVFEGSDGAIDLTISGGTPGVPDYTFNWTGPNGFAAATEDIGTLSAGFYNVTVTDGNSCIKTAVFEIAEPNSLTVNLDASSNVSCNSGNDGSIFITIDGGVSPYSFSWIGTNGFMASSEDISLLSAGSYQVTVTDANGAITNLAIPVVLTEPTVLSISEVINDVSCFGGNDGSIQLTLAGATSPYTYLWSPDGQTTSGITNQIAGNYSVVITDANGCITNENFTISQPTELTITEVVSDATFFGATDGAIILTVTGGTAFVPAPAYLYDWDNDGTGDFDDVQDLTNVPAGIYTVVVKDASDCTQTATFTVNEPVAMTLTLDSQIDVSCFGFADGSIQITAINGTNPITFDWIGSNGFISTTEDLINLPAGIYDVTATDANGITATLPAITITEPPILEITNTLTTNVSCNAGNNGSIQITIAGGTLPYTFQWSNNAGNTATNAGLTADNYSVTITDANNCILLQSFDITEPTPIQIVEVITPISCNGAADGTIDLTVSGGTSSYTYQWNTGATTPFISNLDIGTYVVTVTDANFCTESTSFILNEPSLINIDLVVINSTCGQSNGSITATITGGVAPYSYAWSNSANTSGMLTDVPAGTYTVTVTDNEGCTKVKVGNINNDSPPTITLTNVTNILCHGDNTGAIDIEVSGGTLPYSFSWSNGATTQNISNLTADNYVVVVTDGSGCVVTEGALLTEPTPINIASSSTDISCFGNSDGSIDLTISGGTPGTPSYTFNWTGPNAFTATSEDLMGLIPGIYHVTVTDGNGCTQQEIITIAEPSALSLTSIDQDITCFNANDGAINLTISGGITPYTFQWNDLITSQNRSNLAPGFYEVTVSDANGCNLIYNTTLLQPDELVILETVENVSCHGANDGTISLMGTGGSGNFDYNWSSGETVANIANKAPGMYSVTVSEVGNANCFVTETYNITEPAVLQITNTLLTNVSCNTGNDGSIQITIAGGTLPYTLQWSNSSGNTATNAGLTADSYSVTITDANNCILLQSFDITEPTAIQIVEVITPISCNGAADGAIDLMVSGGTSSYTYQWNTGATTPLISNLDIGTYIVTVTDANFCTESTSFILNEPSLINIDFVVINATCGQSNGSITATVTDGIAPYSYAWSNSANTSNTLIDVPAGTYTVTVTDNTGCTKVKQGSVSNDSAPIINITTITNILCHGDNTGAIEIEVSNGTLPYSFSWSNGATTQNISDLTADDYVLFLTDATGCVTVVGVPITEPDPLNIAFASTNINCFGANDGTIDLMVTGGIANYTFNWIGPNGFAATSEDLTGLIPGLYNVTVTDGNGCTQQESITIAEPLALSLTAINQDITCFNANDGAIDLTIAGGTTPYTFQWNDLITSQNRSNLAPGFYEVTVSDANGCNILYNTTLLQPDELVIVETVDNVSCHGANDGTISLIVTGGSGNFDYNWSSGETVANIANKAPGMYSVTVSEVGNANCFVTETYIITEPAVLQITNTLLTNISCNSGNDGSIQITIAGGTLPYTFQWSNSAGNTATNAGLTADNYSVTITDANNCILLQSFDITEPTSIQIVEVITPISCNGAADGTISLAVSGGTSAYTYQWNTGATTPLISNLDIGTYMVTVTDANFCTESTSFVLNEPSLINIDFVVINATCGQSNGSITATVTDGIAPYSYAWSNSANTSNMLTDVPAGTYTVTVTDDTGCTKVKQGNVSNDSAPIINITIITNILCHGDNTGAIEIEVSNGTLPYSFSWSNGATTQNISDLTADDYVLFLTDATGCVTVIGVPITEPDPINIAFASTDINCFGANDGTIDLTVTGGIANYTFNWIGPNGFAATSEDLTGLMPGIYNVTVTDGNSCTQQESITIVEPSALSLTAIDQDITCFNANDGAIDLTVAGGTTPYTFQWNDLITAINRSNLTPGFYEVTVSDANGCNLIYNTTLLQPDELVILETVENVSCHGANDGTISLTVTGGLGNFDYNWSNGEMGANITNKAPGMYSVTVSEIGNANCFVTETYNITEPAIFEITAATITNTDCNGGSIGEIALTVAGGTGTINYNWSNGESAATISNLAAGNYSVTISDSENCTLTEDYTINSSSNLSATLTVMDASCFGSNNGEIQVVINGGGGNPTFIWNNGVTTQNINNLGGGIYQVTITDGGCTLVEMATVNEGNEITFTNISENNTTCFAGMDGAISFDINGGTGNFTSFAWSNLQMTSIPNITNLAAGNYSVTATDNAGCTATNSFVIDNPTPLNITPNITNTSCDIGNDGQIELLVSGGTLPYTYNWSPNANSTSNIATNLTAGFYDVTVSDINGCTQTETIEITSPLPTTISAVISNITCFGLSDGQIQVNTSGGGGILEYSIDGTNFQTSDLFENLSTGIYAITVKNEDDCTVILDNLEITEPTALTLSSNIVDATIISSMDGSIDLTVSGGTGNYNFNWSTGQNSEDLQNLEVGDYFVTITDINGCEIMDSFTIGVNSTGVLNLNLMPQNLTCNGAGDGSIDLQITGGTGSFTTNWTGPNGYSFTGEDPINLQAGTYLVTVVDDNNGLMSTDMVDITQPTGITGFATAGKACFGESNGTLTMNFSGGNPSYTYTVNGTILNQTLIENLPASNYSILVTDANMCSFAANEVEILENPAIVIATANSIPVTCKNGNDGAIETMISGGTNIFMSTTWLDENDLQVGVTPTLSMQAAGTFDLNVVDNLGCTQAQTFEITEPDSILFTSNITDVLCFGDNTGNIQINNITGGNGGYSYLWNDASVATNLPNIAAGSYSVTISDSEDCEQSATFDIIEPMLAVSATILTTDVSCYGEANGQINALGGGGTGLLNYAWSNAETTSIITDLLPGDYFLTVTDEALCTHLDTISITQPDTLTLTFAAIDLACFGDNNGEIDMTVTGGTPDYEIEWEDGTFTNVINNLTAGTYSVDVSYNFNFNNVAQCIVTESATVEQPDQLVANQSVQDVSCFDGDDGAIVLNPSGGISPYSYNWNTGESTQNIDLLPIGIYANTITDANNCQLMSSDTIAQPTVIFVSSQIQRAGCKNDGDGYIEIIPSGGVAPYIFNWSNGAITQDVFDMTAGNYSLNMQDANGCSYSEDFVIAATPSTFDAHFLAASGLFNVDSVEVNADDIIQFVDVSFPEPNNWLWTFGDSPTTTSTEPNPQFSYPNNPDEDETSYLVKLIASNEFCIDSLEKVIYITNNLRIKAPQIDSTEYLGFNKVLAFPNPTNDFLNLEIELTREETVTIELYNVNGYIFEKQELSGQDSYELQLDVSDLETGMYFIRVKSLNQVYTLKIVVEKR